MNIPPLLLKGRFIGGLCFQERERKERVRRPRIKYGAGPEWLAAMRSHGIGEFFKIRFLADF